MGGIFQKRIKSIVVNLKLFQSAPLEHNSPTIKTGIGDNMKL